MSVHFLALPCCVFDCVCVCVLEHDEKRGGQWATVEVSCGLHTQLLYETVLVYLCFFFIG